MTERVEIEITAKTDVGDALKKLSTELQAYHETAAKSVKEVGEKLKHTHEHAGLVKTAIKSVGDVLDKAGQGFAGLSSSFGPVGAVAGAVGGAVAFGAGAAIGMAGVLERLASSSLNLHYAAQEMGTTPQDLLEVQQGLQRLGLTHEEAGARLGSFFGKMRDLSSRKFASQVGHDLQQLGEGGMELAERLAAIYKATGNTKDTIIEVARVMRNATPAQRLYLSQMLDVPERIAFLDEAMRKNITTLVLSFAEAQKYHDAWVTMSVTLENIGTALGGTIITKLNELYEHMKAKGVFDAFNRWLQEFDTDHFIAEIDKVLGYAGVVVKGVQKARGHLEPYRGVRWGFHWDTFMKNMDRFNRPGPSPEDFLGVGVKPKPYGAMTDDEIIRFKTDNVKNLETIRDVLAGPGGDGQAGTGTGGGHIQFRPGVGQGVASGGPDTGTGSGGANYFRGQPLPGPGDLVTVETKAGRMTVNKLAAADMVGFVNDMVDAGAPKEVIGSYAKRMIAGTNRWSMHAYGAAFDYGQSSRNRVAADFKNWAMTHKEELREALKRRHMISGGDWRSPDFGHFEWRGPGGREQEHPATTPPKDSQSKAMGEAIDRSIADVMMSPVQGNIRFNVLAPPGTKVETSAGGIFQNNTTVDRTIRRDPWAGADPG